MALKAVFGSCKSISGKYSIFRKGKYFHVFGYISKIFLKIFFWCLEKKKEKTNQTNQEEGQCDRTSIVEITIDGAIAPLVNRDLADRRVATIEDRNRRARSLDDRTARRSRCWSIDERPRRTIAPLVDRCSPIWALSSLSLSPRSGLSLLSLSLSFSENELK